MSIKITGGLLSGRVILSPKSARPTTSASRAAIFSSIGMKIDSSIVLDLFAGSGSVGLEALSRGSSFVTFVENNSSAVSIIKQNTNSLDLQDRCSIKKMDVFKYIRGLEGISKFDYIFVDPPYNLHKRFFKQLNEILLTLTMNHLNPRGKIFFECSDEDFLLSSNDSVNIIRKKMNSTYMLIYTYEST
ncbi:MAG: RsmD family RNA methyltransferase [Chlamydiia bacterium]|nr:RsmD family RNA methyltransferase [Chlamydiia bacterium]